MRVAKVFSPGEKITISELVEADHRNRYKPVTYTVIRQYPHHVLCMDAAGNRRCIQNAELLSNSILGAAQCIMPMKKIEKDRNWH